MRETSAPAIQGTVWISLNILQPGFCFFFPSGMSSLHSSSAVQCAGRSRRLGRDNSEAGGAKISRLGGRRRRRRIWGSPNRHAWSGGNKLWSLSWRQLGEKFELAKFRMARDRMIAPANLSWCISIYWQGSFAHLWLTLWLILDIRVTHLHRQWSRSFWCFKAQHGTCEGIYSRDRKKKKNPHLCF